VGVAVIPIRRSSGGASITNKIVARVYYIDAVRKDELHKRVLCIAIS
jgi:hypothetical protein